MKTSAAGFSVNTYSYIFAGSAAPIPISRIAAGVSTRRGLQARIRNSAMIRDFMFTDKYSNE